MNLWWYFFLFFFFLFPSAPCYGEPPLGRYFCNPGGRGDTVDTLWIRHITSHHSSTIATPQQHPEQHKHCIPTTLPVLACQRQQFPHHLNDSSTPAGGKTPACERESERGQQFPNVTKGNKRENGSSSKSSTKLPRTSELNLFATALPASGKICNFASTCSFGDAGTTRKSC